MKQAKMAGHSILTAEAAEALLNGSENYTEYLVQTYLHNLVKNTDPKSPLAYRIMGAVENCLSMLPYLNPENATAKDKFPRKKKQASSKMAYPPVSRPMPNAVDEKDWDHVARYYKTSVENFKGNLAPSVTFINLDQMVEILHLGDVEREVLRFLHVANHPEISAITHNLVGTDRARLPSLISRYIEHPTDVKKVYDAISPNSPLVTTGMIQLADTEDEDELYPSIDEDIRQILMIPNVDKTTMVENVLGRPAEAILQTSDFSYIAKDIDYIKQQIKAAVEQGQTGINILLHGPAGSGKTELSKAIAAELGLTLYSVGEKDEGQDIGSAQHRVGKLFLAHSFLKGSKDAILLFDEIEDLLNKGTDTEKKADTFSKIVVNRLIENNPVVTIWAGNDPDKFHDSVRQRFTYSIYVDYPPVMMRMKVWEKQLELNGLDLPKQDVAYLSRKYQAPPRMIANAIGSACRGDRNVAAIELSLRASSRITYGHADALEIGGSVSEKFSLDLLNYDKGKENYFAAIIASGQSPRPYSLLMQGLPGSGIANTGRYLAEVAAMNPLELDMRELCAPHPMRSPESKIRSAFQAAADSKNLLIISNLDALSEDIEKSGSQWRNGGLTSVFLDGLYHHDLPVVASIFNPDRELPPSLQDAFTLQLKFSPLSGDQCRSAYKIYFGDEAPAEIQFPDRLVPGDFATVHKIKGKNLNGGPEPTELVRLLGRQIANRGEGTIKPGF
jgi:transitional endoplasmic reticulum ATPase